MDRTGNYKDSTQVQANDCAGEEWVKHKTEDQPMCDTTPAQGAENIPDVKERKEPMEAHGDPGITDLYSQYWTGEDLYQVQQRRRMRGVCAQIRELRMATLCVMEQALIELAQDAQVRRNMYDDNQYLYEGARNMYLPDASPPIEAHVIPEVHESQADREAQEAQRELDAQAEEEGKEVTTATQGRT